MLAIEILSPEDKPLRVDRTIAEWLEFGVGYVWVIDPENLESVRHTLHGRVGIEDATLRIPGSAIEVPLRQLDEEVRIGATQDRRERDEGGPRAVQGDRPTDSYGAQLPSHGWKKITRTEHQIAPEWRLKICVSMGLGPY